jgi:hypothetical protein
MSKWLNVLCAAIATAGLGFVIAINVNENRNFKKFGKVAAAEPIAGYVQETTVSKKRLTGLETTTTKDLATMTYATEDKKKITFKRYLTEEDLRKFNSGETVYVEYIPGEYNTERLIGKSGSLLPVALALLAALGWLIFAIRRPV